MYSHQPGTENIREMVQDVRIRYTIHGSIYSYRYQKQIGDMAESRPDAGDHTPSALGFDQEDERHDGEDVVMRGERRQPMDSKVPHPDDQYGKVDREDPDHENKDRMRVVIEIAIGVERL